MSLRSQSPAPGVAAFCELMANIKALPELLRDGYAPGDDDSMAFDYAGAARLTQACLRRHSQDKGFVRALAVAMRHADGGITIEWTPEQIEGFFDGTPKERDSAPESRSKEAVARSANDAMLNAIKMTGGIVACLKCLQCDHDLIDLIDAAEELAVRLLQDLSLAQEATFGDLLAAEKGGAA